MVSKPASIQLYQFNHVLLYTSSGITQLLPSFAGCNTKALCLRKQDSWRVNAVHNSISVTHLPSFCEQVLWHQVKGKWCMLEVIPCMPLTCLQLQLPDKSWFAAKQPVKEAENLASFFTCLSINTLSCNSQNSLHKLPIGNPSHALFLVIGIPKLISSIPCTYARCILYDWLIFPFWCLFTF